MTDKDLLKRALTAFESGLPIDRAIVMRLIRDRLENPDPEPWGYISHKSWKMPVFVEADNLDVSGLPFNNPDYTPVYKAPPQREFQRLSEEEFNAIWIASEAEWKYLRMIEDKLKEKNT